MSDFAVELQDVVKRFPTPEGGEVFAVNHVTMQIKNGEFFSMLGSSGCGKTTSLRIVAGFEWPTSGEVFIEGVPQGHTPPFKRQSILYSRTMPSSSICPWNGMWPLAWKWTVFPKPRD